MVMDGGRIMVMVMVMEEFISSLGTPNLHLFIPPEELRPEWTASAQDQIHNARDGGKGTLCGFICPGVQKNIKTKQTLKFKKGN